MGQQTEAGELRERPPSTTERRGGARRGPEWTSHRDFGLGVGLTRNPFGKPTNTLSNELATEGAAVTVSNLAKTDQDGEAARYGHMDRSLKCGLFPVSLRSCVLDHVVFFVGPTRESVLREKKERFSKGNFSRRPGRRPVVRFHPPRHVQATWSYHPGYFRRSGKWSVVGTVSSRLSRDELETNPTVGCGG